MKVDWGKVQGVSRELGVQPCFIEAVAHIESGGRGFDASGRVVVRFERHVFTRELKKRGVSGKIVEEAAKLAGIRWETLHRAMVLHEEAALSSASFGMFQIMGFNYSSAGFDSVRAFVEYQKQGEEQQLETFCAFARTTGLLPIMRRLDFTAFARRYNGPAYAINNYDRKLQNAYERCVRNKGETPAGSNALAD